jgi:hypothetical protein
MDVRFCEGSLTTVRNSKGTIRFPRLLTNTETLVFLYFEVTGRPFTGHAPDTSFILEILPLNQVKALR